MKKSEQGSTWERKTKSLSKRFLNSFNRNKSLFFFQLATQVDPECPVAWQGLSNLLDLKPELGSQEDSITVYTRMADILTE